MIGKIINYRYEVLEKIGDGPLFSVYKSRDKVLNRLVALKTPVRDLADNGDFGRAMVAGYREAAGLNHPNIARLLDADCIENECFIACEYARGVSVKERVRRAGPIATPLAVDIIIPVLSALEFAHSNGVIHGDVGPQDVIVSPDGEVKLTDFGISQALAACPAVADRYTMRSVHYLAPEVIEGAAPTQSADLYSVGIILYEMLTGQLPFDGTTAVAVALKKVKDAPAIPRSVNTAVPKSLNDIVMKAIAASPEARYQNASAMLADLKAISQALRTGVPASVGPATTPSGAVVARTAEQVAEDAGERVVKTQFKWMFVLFIAVCLAATGVTFLLKSGDAQVRVPVLLGKSWDEAQYEAKNAGIKLLDDGTVFSDAFPVGQICSVAPPANAMVPKSNPVVKVKISAGASQARVPDVHGRSEPDATSAITQAGFMVGKIAQAYNSTVPVNHVISQEPDGGLLRQPGSTVDLRISQGPKPEPEATEPEPSPDDQAQAPRKFNVGVQVPADAGDTQDVRILVSDDRGSTVAYDEPREPGDEFTVTVTAYGSTARIRVYVGGSLVSDDTY